jgi:TRAP-type C4-dicarboxylate transport system substrate-binding protein
MIRNHRTAGHRSPRATAVLAGAASCALVGALAGCDAPTDRAGGDTVVLHLATSDGEGIDPATYQGPQAFMDAVSDVSGGRLEVEIDWDYASGAADAETQVVDAIATGDVDGGWPPSRAFAHADVEGLASLEAPMLLASEAAIEELVTGDVAGAALTELDGTGLTGLGLMAAPLRRPVSGTKPLVAPADWTDATFRVYNSPVQAATVRALGARPVNMTFAWADALRVGDLDGAEVDVVTAGLPTQVGHITANVVLWPKVFVLTFNEDLLDSLTAQQQEWLRQAADRAVAASVDAPYDASADLQPYCDRGTQVHAATTEQLAALRAAVAPVLEDLRRDEETSALMRAVEDLAGRFPDTDVPPPAGGCDARTPGSGDGPDESVAPIREGTYRTEVPESATAEVGNAEGWTGTWTMRIEDGTFVVTCRPLDLPGTDCGHATTDDALEAGYLRGDDGTVTFVPDGALLAQETGCELPPTEDDPDACLVLPPYSATWTQDGDQLEFRDSTQHHLTLATWQRVGP